MSDARVPAVAVLDYGLGNLFSVKHACEKVGLHAFVTSSPADVVSADAVILPGMGAFGDAMHALATLDLIEPLKDVVAAGRPLVGVCLGMQLVMRESWEFGRHRGLGLIDGEVVRLIHPAEGQHPLKVPQVGWNGIHRPAPRDSDAWSGTLLADMPNGAFMYFVHSFYVRPADERTVLAVTSYGPNVFCSAIQSGSVFGCQFHPERSGPDGLRIYQNLSTLLQRTARDRRQQDCDGSARDEVRPV